MSKTTKKTVPVKKWSKKDHDRVMAFARSVAGKPSKKDR
jgi:hypothetical protein